MKDKLNNIIKKLEGSILVIGIEDDKVLNIINSNKKVTSFIFINKNKKNKLKLKSEGKIKNINIKKLKKYFKKKSFDIIICDFSVIRSYLLSFIFNSIRLNKKKIYYFGLQDKYDLDILRKRYERFGSITTLEIYDDEFILAIDNSNVKMNYIQKIKYKFLDLLGDIINYIGDLLVG